MYFTSWDANVFLCLLSVFPEEVVRGMIKMVKKTHEDYIREESLEYWLSLPDPCFYRCIGKASWSGKSLRTHNQSEFSKLWRWRCPESRRSNVVQWAQISRGLPYINNTYINNPGEKTSIDGYWNSGEAWSYSIKDWDLDTSEWEGHEEEEYFNMKERQRREYVGDWYANIHEGRYFLFFKENDITSNKLIGRFAHVVRSNSSICSTSREGCIGQVAQDLLTIDGGGLGEKPGNHIEHIDDLFP